MLPSRFSFLSTSSSEKVNDSFDTYENKLKPTLNLHTDKDVYRPGDSIFVTIEVGSSLVRNHGNRVMPSLLVEKLSFELKGIEKLDVQWFSTQKPFPGSKGRRGEHVFLDSSTPSLTSNQLLSLGAKKSYMVRAVLPDIIPPSYKGAIIRYLYYVRATLCGKWLTIENSECYKDSRKDFTEVETRIPIQVWVIQKNNGLLLEESQNDGIVPTSTIQTEIYWKAMDEDSEWARANEAYDSGEDGYDSARDETSSVSSYLNKGNLKRTFGSSSSLLSGPRLSMKDSSFIEERMGQSPNLTFSQLSVAEVLYDSGADGYPSNNSSNYALSNEQPNQTEPAGGSLSPQAGTSRLVPSEGFTRGRSYNIRMDDQVLVKFSPKNADSTYYFSDTIGGTLTFFHEEGARRCLEVSVTLETSETINRRFVHPSRRNSPRLSKVQSDHHEVVADLVQTSFLFSIPMDGPMSFSTPHVSVQWILRFEFLMTPKNVDLSRYEHPLLIEERDRSEWILPITVHAPPPRTSVAHNRSDKLFSLEPSWVP